MGFFTDPDPGFRSDTATLTPLPHYSDGNPLGAAFRQSNIVASTIHRIANSGPFEPDPTHNPLDTIRGTKYEAQHLNNFVGSRSEAETRTIMRRIDSEENDRKILEAAGAGGVMLNVLAGTIDPTILLPGSIAIRSGRAGYEFTRAAVNVGAAGALQAGAQEAVLQATQETRTAGETALNVASGTVLAGLIGGAASRLLSPVERATLEQSLDRVRADIDAHANPVAPAARPAPVASAPPLIPEPPRAPEAAGLGVAQPAGAAATDIRTLEMPSSIPGTSRLSVTRRTMEAESVVARRAMADTAETPYSYKQSAEGVAAVSAPPVDRLVKMEKDGTSYAVGQELDRLFIEYRFGAEPPAMARIRAGIDDVLGRTEGKMSYGDFKKQVAQAMMFGDAHEIPQVAAAAQFIRAKALDPWADRAEKAVESFKRLDPAPGESYFPHAWNKEKIKAQRPAFTDRLTELYKSDQSVKAAAKGRLTFFNAQLNSWEAQIVKIEARFGRAEERAKRLDARAAERSRDEINLTAGLNDADPKGRAFELQRRKVELEAEAKDLDELIDLMREMDGVAIPALMKKSAEALDRRLTSIRVEGARLSEAGRQAKRSGKRLAALEDQLDKTETRKVLIEDTLSLAEQFRNEVRAKIEAELGAWEGKSAQEAKSALKSREKYAEMAARAEDAPRLAGADSAVDRAVRKIIASDRDLSDQELRSIAQQTVDRILGSPDGRLPYDAMTSPRASAFGGEDARGSLHSRQLNVTNAWARDWIEDDIEHVVSSHLRTFVPDVVLAERHGDVEMSAVMRAVEEDYARLIDQTKSEKQATKLGNERDAVIRDLAGVRDRIRGVFGWDPGTANMARVATVAKQVNNITSMGMSAIASIPDFAGAPLRHGVMSTFRDGWAPFFQSMLVRNDGLEKQKAHIRSLGLGVDTALNLRQHAFDDIVDGYRPQSRVERALQWTSDKFFVANMLAPLTDLQKQLAGSVAIPAALRAAKAITEGKATKAQIRDMADAGIDANLASRIHRQVYELGHGGAVDGVHLPNTADWTDRAAAQAFDAAIAREIDIMVVTPGQEKPLLMSKPVGSLLLQFKSFPAAATERILISNLQRRDAKALSGVMTSLALGMLSYKINSVLGGQPVSERPQDWIKEGISRSGMIGWLEEGNAMAAKLSRGTVDIHRLYGADKPLSRYASRSIADSFLGPTAGKLAQIGQVGGAAFSGEWGESDTKAVRRLTFFQNLFWLRQAFNQVETSTNSYFNVPGQAK